MRKICTLALAALLAAVFTAPAMADNHDKKWELTSDIRTRFEVSENITDLEDEDSPGDNDNLSFGTYRAQLRLDASLAKNVMGTVELQAFGVWGEDDTPGRTHGDSIGQVQSDSEISDESTTNKTEIYQLIISLMDLGGSGIDLHIGRQEHEIGNELHVGNLDYYNGTVYDGARGMWSNDNVSVDAFHYWIEEQDIEAEDFDDIDINGGDDDVTFCGVNVDINFADNTQSISPYALYLRDGQEGGDRIDLYTIGALWTRSEETAVANGELIDWSLEAAVQSGDIDPDGADLSLGGMIIEGAIGFNFGEEGDRRHRASLNLLMASGDDDNTDDDLDGFFQLAPDTHHDNRLGDLDLFSGGFTEVGSLVSFGDNFEGMSNVSNINLRYDYTGASGNNNFYVALHQFTLAEDQVSPGSSFDDDDIGTEIDVVYEHMYSENVAFEFGASQFSSGDFLDEASGFDTDDVTRF